jgi:hypothetical protein
VRRWKRKKVTLRINIDYLYWKAQEGKGTKATPMLAPMKNQRAQDSQKQFVGTKTTGYTSGEIVQWDKTAIG